MIFLTTIGTPLTKNAIKVFLCGSGELGKEVAIELQRLGVEVIALDRYENAPAMQVAHRSYTIQMTDGAALRAIIEKEKPDFIVPEIEALATNTLIDLEKDGFKVVPSAKAVSLTMNREGVRRLASETLGLKTSKYDFAETEDEVRAVAQKLGFPCVIKPIMSSSGKGQSVLREESQISKAFEKSQREARGGSGKQMKVIVEEFVPFDYEVTLLTIQSVSGTVFCEPIGHVQINGDYANPGSRKKCPPRCFEKREKAPKK